MLNKKITKAMVAGLAVLGLAATFLPGCSSINPAPIADKLLWKNKSRPSWTLETVEFKRQVVYFTGLSDYWVTERLAREDGISNAQVIAARFAGSIVDDVITVLEQSQEKGSEIRNPDIRRKVESVLRSRSLIEQAKVDDIYLEQWQKKDEVFWRSIVRLAIPADVFRKAGLTDELLGELTKSANEASVEQTSVIQRDTQAAEPVDQG